MQAFHEINFSEGIPMNLTGIFFVLKEQMDTPAVRQVLALCLFDQSPEGIDRKLAPYRQGGSHQLYGWVVDGEVLGVCGWVHRGDHVLVLNLAVAEHAQRKGIGGAMLDALQEKVRLALALKTDNGAVEFYRKRGFEISVEEEQTRRYGIQRWDCVRAVRG
jgi:GNAT superfamily N-acetyltransferase